MYTYVLSMPTSKHSSSNFLIQFSSVLTLMSRHLLYCILGWGTWEYQWQIGQQTVLKEQQRQQRESEDLRWHLICGVDREATNQTTGNGDAFPRRNTTNRVAFYTYHRQSQSGGWCVKHSTGSAGGPVCTLGSTDPMWRFVIFLINVAFCLCEPVKIRLVFHSKYGLYKYTNTHS